MCLQEFEIDYMDSYNDSMIKHLTNYDAEIYWLCIMQFMD
jgi:hypothetical protein